MKTQQRLHTALRRTAVPIIAAQLVDHLRILEVLTLLFVRVQDEVVDGGVTFHVGSAQDVRHNAAQRVNRYVCTAHTLRTGTTPNTCRRRCRA